MSTKYSIYSLFKLRAKGSNIHATTASSSLLTSWIHKLICQHDNISKAVLISNLSYPFSHIGTDKLLDVLDSPKINLKLYFDGRDKPQGTELETVATQNSHPETCMLTMLTMSTPQIDHPWKIFWKLHLFHLKKKYYQLNFTTISKAYGMIAFWITDESDCQDTTTMHYWIKHDELHPFLVL